MDCILDWLAQLAALRVRGGLQPQTGEEQEANQHTRRPPTMSNPYFSYLLI